MSRFRFQVLEVRDSAPQEWLRVWAGLYPSADDPEYHDLVARYKSLSAEDFERIGKWKDSATTEAQWQPNVASVAYLIWKRAAKELPGCPEPNQVADFLDRWSGETYNDKFSNKRVVKHFGLSRATALLHFLSGGRYPIFDARVRTAIARLCNCAVQNTIPWYLDSFCPIFRELARLCETENDLRRLDKALFSYGGYKKLPFSN
ncbi:MAG TPA: hypothetical protein VNJ52_00040 [Patescibacteria group bacterium]|nr:hypothetical protein [Patescibacteria group bacterium]